MPLIKLSLTDGEYGELSRLARAEDLSPQDYLRYKVFGKKSPSKFTPEEAERRALEKYTDKDGPFTLPDIYGAEWQDLDWRMTGVFGKRFFNYLKGADSPIVFAGMTENGRRAAYRIQGGD